MSKSLNDLRAVLFATLEGVKSGQLEVDKARAINELGKTLIDTAKVEIEYLELVGGKDKSDFLEPPKETALPPGITGVTRHRLGG